MPATINLSRFKLTTFLACQRRFQLRYLRQLPWPVEPQDEQWQEASQRGRRFHRLLERHFLGLPLAEPGEGDPLLQRWWQTFRRDGPALPPGQRLPELTLTVPLARHMLTGRFDLVVIGDEDIHVYDWKTEAQPRPAAALRDDWQTILYLALLAEGGTALRQEPVDPDAITLTYWFVADPSAMVTIPYSRTQHDAHWSQLISLVEAIDSQLNVAGAWPLTEDLSQCARCAYRVFCGRQQLPAGEPLLWAEEEDTEILGLEPDLPG